MRCAGTFARLFPSSSIVPVVKTWPAIAFSSVDFPAPLAPITATTSPFPTSRLTPCSAFRPL
jgi:hypothetical protein